MFPSISRLFLHWRGPKSISKLPDFPSFDPPLNLLNHYLDGRRSSISFVTYIFNNMLLALQLSAFTFRTRDFLGLLCIPILVCVYQDMSVTAFLQPERQWAPRTSDESGRL